MSTKDMAYNIFNQLTEEQLKGFIALFGGIYSTENDDMAERKAAFERMKSVCRYIPDLDEKEELAEYREEKYGK